MSQEDSEFAPDKPEALPRLHVPGLQEDTASLPPEALAGQVPVLTEQVEVNAPASTPAPAAAAAPASATKDADDSPTVFSTGHEATHAQISAMAPVPPNRFAAAASDKPAPKRLSAMAPVTANRFAAGPPVDEAPAAPAVEASPPVVVEPEAEPEPKAKPEPQPEPVPSEDAAPVPVEAVAQEPAPQVDTRREQMQQRIGQLTNKIHALHDRLNRLEKPEA